MGRLGLALNAMLAQIESAFRAREASERKLRRFVADASHELRTPLAAVRAYAELFGRGAAERPDDLARSMSGHQPRVRAHEPARRRPAAPRPPRRGQAARAGARRARRARRRGGRDRADGRTDAADRAGGGRRRRDRRPRPAAPDRRQPARQRPRAHAAGDARASCAVDAATGSAEIVVADAGPGLSRRARITCSSASTAPTLRARGRAAASASGSRSSPPSPSARRERLCPLGPDGGATFTIALPLAARDSQETHGISQRMRCHERKLERGGA